MSSSTLPRPSQVTLAGWMIIVGSVMVVLSVIELLAGMRSLETRQSVEDFLAEPPGESLGLDVEGVLTLWRTAGLVAAGCATGAAVLGWHVLKRHRGARIGLTVLAVPLFLTGVATGGFLSALVAAASLMLWLQPARDWFDGKKPAHPDRLTPPAQEQQPAAGQSDPEQPPREPYGAWQPPARDEGDPPPVSGPPAAPRPFEGFGDPSAPPAQVPGLGSVDAPVGPVAPARRPDSVLVASLITWVLAGLTLLMSLVSTALVIAQPATVMEELERQDPELMARSEITESMVVTTTIVMGGMLSLWAILAIVLAVLTMRRSAGAAAALMISAVFTGIFCLVGTVAALPLIFPAVGAIVVATILRRPEVRAWLLAGRQRPGGVHPPR